MAQHAWCIVYPWSMIHFLSMVHGVGGRGCHDVGAERKPFSYVLGCFLDGLSRFLDVFRMGFVGWSISFFFAPGTVCCAHRGGPITLDRSPEAVSKNTHEGIRGPWCISSPWSRTRMPRCGWLNGKFLLYEVHGPWPIPWCMVGSWSMAHVLSMVQDEDATMWVAEQEVFVV